MAPAPQRTLSLARVRPRAMTRAAPLAMGPVRTLVMVHGLDQTTNTPNRLLWEGQGMVSTWQGPQDSESRHRI